MKMYPFLVFLLLGCACGYLSSGIILYKFNSFHVSNPDSNSILNTPLNSINLELIFKKNILGAKLTSTIHNEGKRDDNYINSGVIDSGIDSYRLIGFISGSHPMALFKKGKAPVVIVDKDTPLQKRWYLKYIKDGVVYIYNKETLEVKKIRIDKNHSTSIVLGQQKNIKVLNIIGKFSMRRELIEENMKNVNKLFKKVRITPYFEKGSLVGYRVGYLNSASLLRKIGLRRGDVILGVNGEPIVDLIKIREMFDQLPYLTSINVDLLRDGKKSTIFIEIE